MPNAETRNCQSCKTNFLIEPEDFAFYDKIKVPPPTWCPECRAARRMNFRNERTLYRRTCQAPGHTEAVISIYAPESPFTIYDQHSWWSDDWDPLDFGREVDFSQSFLAQLRDLWKQVPVIAINNKNAVNSEYCCHALDNKNCYMNAAAAYNEGVNYSNRVTYAKDCSDVYFADHMELCYDAVICKKGYKLCSSMLSDDSSESSFLYDCRGCSHCLGCVGLRNKQYHILNQPFTRDEYEKKLVGLDLGSYKNRERFQEDFKRLRLGSVHKYANVAFSSNITGDNVSQSKDCRNCFDMYENIENNAYSAWAVYNMKDVYDTFGAGDGASLMYEGVDVGVKTQMLKSCLIVWDSHNVSYSYNCHSSSHLFACVGLRNKQYCILNKQYTKEEYERLVPQIIAHMDAMPYVDARGRKYTYGEFFPPELSPFAYNETIAQEYFPLTKEEAVAQGYKWRDPETKQYTITKAPEDLPDHIRDVDDAILQETVGCAHAGTCLDQCTTAFRIIPEELSFYRRMNLPLPRLCPNCRHYERLRQRNPLKLWHRKCMCKGERGETRDEKGGYTNTAKHPHGENSCPTEFETSYAPERPEIVYCEACYNAEVA